MLLYRIICTKAYIHDKAFEKLTFLYSIFMFLLMTVSYQILMKIMIMTVIDWLQVL
jgi:hypothetical protein